MTAFGFIIPVIHILILYFEGYMGKYNPLGPLYLVFTYFTILGVGTIIGFVLEFPERQFPNKFDILGSSH